MGRNGNGPKDSIAAMIEEETMNVSPYVEAVVPTIDATTAELEDPTAAVVNQQNSYVSSATKSRIWIFYIAGLLSTICWIDALEGTIESIIYALKCEKW